MSKLMTGSIYFVQAGDYVKIGFTAQLKKRLEKLQTGNPHRLTLLAVIPNSTRSIEAAFHRLFEGERTRARGEWFELSPRIKHVIDAIAAGAGPRNAASIRALLPVSIPRKTMRRAHILRKIKRRQYFEELAERQTPSVYSDPASCVEMRNGLKGRRSRQASSGFAGNRVPLRNDQEH